MVIRVKPQTFVPIFIVTLLLVGAVSLAVGLDGADGKEGEAEKKLQERLVVLQEIAQLEVAAYQGGEGKLVSVLAARKEFLQATLELTKEAAKRIQILVEHVKLAKELEEAVLSLFKLNEATKMDVLKAKAARLKAEADLAEEQSRMNAPKK